MRLYTRLLPALRQYALTGALAAVAAGVSVNMWQHHHARLQQTELARRWLWQGDSLLHLGQTHRPPLGQLVRLPSAATSTETTLLELPLTTRQLRHLTPTIVRELSTAGYIPLLSWQVPASSDTTWAPRLRQLARGGAPVLLRPVLPPSLPADQYRRQWQQLARVARVATNSSLILVWTLPAKGQPIDFFPGRATLHWLAAECPNGEADYATQRAAVARYPELHQLPVLLLTDVALARSHAAALASRYPELKALINRPPATDTWFARR